MNYKANLSNSCYLIIFTDFYDYNKKNSLDKSYYELCLTKEEAEIRAIDLFYKHINEFIKSNTNYMPLQERSKYSIDDIDYLMNIISTEFVEYKYKVEIKQIEIPSE